MGKTLSELEGQHYNTLVHILNKGYIKGGEKAGGLSNVGEYLHKIVEKCFLITLPIESEGIFSITDKSKNEFLDDVLDFFDLSEEYGELILTPFPITAIEDKESLVILDKNHNGNCIVTMCYNLKQNPKKVQPQIEYLKAKNVPILDEVYKRIPDLEENIRQSNNEEPYNSVMITIGKIGTDKKDFGIDSVLYNINWKNETRAIPLHNFNKFQSLNGLPFSISDIIRNDKEEIRVISDLLRELEDYCCETDLINAFRYFILENVYISSPDTFIVEKESKQSLALGKKYSKNSNKHEKKLRKKCIRPHYICLDENRVRRLFRRESDISFSVRGHKRHLGSDYFTHKQGKTIWIEQYIKGTGKTRDNDNQYTVWLKKAPNRVVPCYQNEQPSN